MASNLLGRVRYGVSSRFQKSFIMPSIYRWKIIARQSSNLNCNLDEKNYKLLYLKSSLFQSKPTKELLRSFLILKASSMDRLVTYSERIFLLGEQLVWGPLFRWIMKSTFYGQFAAGETLEDAIITASRLKVHNILSMLCVPIESKVFATKQEAEAQFEKNYNTVLKCINGTAAIESNGFAQLKITSLCEKELLIEINKHLEKYQLNHKEEGDWDIKTMVNLVNASLYDTIKIAGLSNDYNAKLGKLLSYLDKLAQRSEELGIRLMIDAEQTYMQAALNYLVLVFQAKYNKDRPVVYNTYQCYRKDTFQRLQSDLNLAKNLGFLLSCKAVRGAYMAEERRLAKEKNTTDPINDSYVDTTAMYHLVVSYLLPYVEKKQVGLMIASHNEETVMFAKKRIAEAGLSKNDKNICFGQLYGLCDHVSYNLGKEGYVVYKSVPFGPINETLLYLSRRAHENKSVMERTSFEITLIKKELKKRFLSRIE